MVNSEGELLAVQIRPVGITPAPMTRFSYVTIILILILTIMLYTIYIYIMYDIEYVVYSHKNANACYMHIYIFSYIAMNK